MIYAPVIIPTLDRYDHLKQCLDSLNRCHNADKTEVSVDYPPASKYIEGHDRICEYLESSHFVFKQLHVIKQTENLGVINDGFKIIGNLLFLEELITKKYDRWIESEDDNVFAPGFLDFMNESLERFKDDKTVFSVCGYRFYYNLLSGDNNFLRQHSDFNAWGCGFWKDKMVEIPGIEVGYFRKMLYNPFKVLKLWQVSNLQVAHLSAMSYKANFKKGDNFFTIYMIDRGMTQIMPTTSLVRNIGWDGTGIHCDGFDNEVSNKHLYQAIDESPLFQGLRGTGWEYFKENERVIREEDFQRYSFLGALHIFLKRLMDFRK